jgi:hypothetical protein
VKDKAGGLSLTAEALGADAATAGGGAGMEGTGVWLVLGLVPGLVLGLASDDEPPQADKSPGSDITDATNHPLKERSPMDVTRAGSFGRSSRSEFHVGSMTARRSPCVAQGRLGVSHE